MILQPDKTKNALKEVEARKEKERQKVQKKFLGEEALTDQEKRKVDRELQQQIKGLQQRTNAKVSTSATT